MSNVQEGPPVAALMLGADLEGVGACGSELEMLLGLELHLRKECRRKEVLQEARRSDGIGSPRA